MHAVLWMTEYLFALLISLIILFLLHVFNKTKSEVVILSSHSCMLL